MAVATGSHRRHYDLKTTRHKALFERVFRHVVTGDQGRNSIEEKIAWVSA